MTSQFTVESRLDRAETRLTRLYLLEGTPAIGYYHRIPQPLQLEKLSGIEQNLSDLATSSLIISSWNLKSDLKPRIKDKLVWSVAQAILETRTSKPSAVTYTFVQGWWCWFQLFCFAVSTLFRTLYVQAPQSKEDSSVGMKGF